MSDPRAEARRPRTRSPSGTEAGIPGWMKGRRIGIAVVAVIVVPFLHVVTGARMPFLVDIMHETHPWQVMQDHVLDRAPAEPPLWNPGKVKI